MNCVWTALSPLPCPIRRAETSADRLLGRSPDIFEYGAQEVQALCQRSGNASVAGHWTMGATDA
jgi:hypothetical protein